MINASNVYQWIRILLIVFGTIMSWASAQTAIKHRFYRQIFLEELKNMEIALGLKPLPHFKAVHYRGKNRLWERPSSEIMLIICLLFLTIGFAVLSAHEVFILIV